MGFIRSSSGGHPHPGPIAWAFAAGLAVGFALAWYGLHGFQNGHSQNALITDAPKDWPGNAPIPYVSPGERGFEEARMWKVLFKSPTAAQAEMKAREELGGRSPFGGKTNLEYSCLSPGNRRIYIPAKFSEPHAALAYAYELKNFEAADILLSLLIQLRRGALSMAEFADRCMDLEARAAYQQVKVARELRKAWVLGAHSDWEDFCMFGEGEKESVQRILSAIRRAGVIEGTEITARRYYMWMAGQNLAGVEGGEDTQLAP